LHAAISFKNAKIYFFVKPLFENAKIYFFVKPLFENAKIPIDCIFDKGLYLNIRILAILSEMCTEFGVKTV